MRQNGPRQSQKEIFWQTSLRDPNLSSISQAGLVNNLNDGMAWGLFPLLFASAGMNLAQIGILAAIYPAVWGACQLFTDALSDRIGRKGLIVGGMWSQAVGIAVITVRSLFAWFFVGAVFACEKTQRPGKPRRLIRFERWTQGLDVRQSR